MTRLERWCCAFLEHVMPLLVPPYPAPITSLCNPASARPILGVTLFIYLERMFYIGLSAVYQNMCSASRGSLPKIYVLRCNIANFDNWSNDRRQAQQTLEIGR